MPIAAMLSGAPIPLGIIHQPPVCRPNMSTSSSGASFLGIGMLNPSAVAALSSEAEFGNAAEGVSRIFGTDDRLFSVGILHNPCVCKMSAERILLYAEQWSFETRVLSRCNCTCTNILTRLGLIGLYCCLCFAMSRVSSI